MVTDKTKYRGNFKGYFFYKCYLAANWCSRGRIRRIVSTPVWVVYRFFFNWLMGIDILETTKIGDNLVMWHGTGLIVHPDAVIGNNVVLRHNTTIGNTRSGGKAPIIGNNVEIGTGVIILGEITIGDNAKIGAGAVVTKSVPANATVIGNPAKQIF